MNIDFRAWPPDVAKAVSFTLLCVLTAYIAPRDASLPIALDPGAPEDEWPAYGRDPGGMRFSPLAEITPANVGESLPGARG